MIQTTTTNPHDDERTEGNVAYLKAQIVDIEGVGKVSVAACMLAAFRGGGLDEREPFTAEEFMTAARRGLLKKRGAQ